MYKKKQNGVLPKLNKQINKEEKKCRAFLLLKRIVLNLFFKCQTHSLKDLTICVKRPLEGAATITQSSEPHTKSIWLDISKIYFFLLHLD